LIRLSIGIEDVNDLLEDLQRAFALAMGTPLPESDPSPPSPLRGETPQPIKILRPPSTMHTSDRTIPEPPSMTPMVSSKRLQNNEELEQLRRQIAKHDQNRTLLSTFVAGFAVALALSSGVFAVMGRSR